MVNPNEKLESLLKKQEELKKMIASEEAKIKDQKRRDDTRKKILVGSYFLETGKYEDIKRYMDGYLKKDNDRLLFDLDIIQIDKSKPVIKEPDNDQNT